ncbi:MAG: hypothetical protein ABR915_13380 [Thermoguttaceae bacterium]|jgi:hypothetical protein
MKKLVLGYFLGVATAVLVVLACMGTGTPFKSMPMKCGIDAGTGIVFTERFMVVYEGMDGDEAVASGFTYAGTHGTLPAFWRGYGEGWTGGASGIESLRTYEPSRGTATFYFHGKLLRVEEDGRYLRVQDQLLPLGTERIVAVVDKAGSCHQLRGQEADRLVQSIPSWYQDPELNARPARVTMAER